MEKGQKVKIFNQFYLSQLPNLDITSISKYEKVQAFTKGCLLRRNKHLYQNLRAFTDDLQTILSYDPESANIVFQQYKQIRFHHNESNKEDSRVNVQCRRCGQYTPPFKYCPKCQDVHYCSEVCEINIKLTHEKQECKIKSYPKTHHPILVEVHFGSNLGQNIQIYFQHEARAYGLVRGKQIIKQLYQFFIGIKKTANSDLRDTSRRTKIEQKLTKYKLELKNNEKYLQFQLRNEKDYPTGILKVDLQDMDALKSIYEQNQLLEQIQLYLLEQGSLMIECAEEIHNNHVHYVYIFRIP